MDCLHTWHAQEHDTVNILGIARVHGTGNIQHAYMVSTAHAINIPPQLRAADQFCEQLQRAGGCYAPYMHGVEKKNSKIIWESRVPAEGEEHPNKLLGRWADVQVSVLSRTTVGRWPYQVIVTGHT